LREFIGCVMTLRGEVGFGALAEDCPTAPKLLPIPTSTDAMPPDGGYVAALSLFSDGSSAA